MSPGTGLLDMSCNGGPGSCRTTPVGVAFHCRVPSCTLGNRGRVFFHPLIVGGLCGRMHSCLHVSASLGRHGCNFGSKYSHLIRLSRAVRLPTKCGLTGTSGGRAVRNAKTSFRNSLTRRKGGILLRGGLTLGGHICRTTS